MIHKQKGRIIRLGFRIVLAIIYILSVNVVHGQQLGVVHSTNTCKIILITPNIDDDDGDGKSDAEDEIINGPADRDDLTTIEVPMSVDDCSPIFEGPGAALYRVLEIKKSNRHGTTILVEAKEPRSKRSTATLKFSEKSPSAQDMSFYLDVKPFVLTSSIDPVSEVFVVETPNSRQFIEELKSVFTKIKNAPTLTVIIVENGDKRDVWIQDATEIGFFEETSIFAALAGLRAKHNPFFRTGLLDRHFMKTFGGCDRCVLTIGEPLAKRRWIDWFGNLESTPPLTEQDDEVFPFGRILTGCQKELGMHDAVMDFLQVQSVQWPPIILDTGFLMIGHVDEIVNFFPTRTGFKTIFASPSLGRELLERLDHDGHGKAVILKDKKGAETTIEQVLRNAKLMSANDSATRVMMINRRKLMNQMNLDENDIIDLPVIFKSNGGSLWPNPVNGLVIGNHYILPKPFGPVVDGTDVVEEACQQAFVGTGTVLHFLDDYDAYSSHAGEIHCGTNAVRRRVKQ